MPTGQPDFRFAPQEGDEGVWDEIPAPSDAVETTADRIVREAMEAGDFEDLPGTGKPIPGAGTVDDELWWVRSWVKRNLQSKDQAPKSSE